MLKLVGAIIAGCQQYENREFECRTRPCVTLAHRLKAPKSESLCIHSRTYKPFWKSKDIRIAFLSWSTIVFVFKYKQQ